MKRIYVIYEGETFSVSGREPDELRSEIRLLGFERLEFDQEESG